MSFTLKNYSEKFNKHYLFLMEVFIGIAIFFLPISKALIEIGSISAIVLWLSRKVIIRESIILPRSILLPYLIFIVMGVISLFLIDHADWKLGFRGILKWLQFFGFFFLCAEWFQNKDRAHRALFIFLASMTLITFNGFYQLATGMDFLRHVSLDPGRIIRMKSSLGAPNTLAAFYLFAIPLTATLLPRFKKWRVLIFGMALLFGIGLILTFSRAAFLALFTAFFCTLIMNKKWKWLLVALGILTVAFVFSPPLYQNFIGSLNLKDISVGERIRYWTYSWEMIKSNPLLGVGLNHYLAELPHFVPVTETYRGYAHNSYLQIWAETGLIGLLSFLFPLVHLNALRSNQKPPPTLLNTCLFIGCSAFLIQAAFDNHFFSMQPAFLFWTLWGMKIANDTSDRT